MGRTALITGITGQDGRYLAELLVRKSYRIHGVLRTSSRLETSDELRDMASLEVVDLSDDRSVATLLQEVQPDEIYNLAAISSLEESDADPGRTVEINAGVPIRFVWAIARAGAHRETRFCQASSSQIFGPPDGRLRDEATEIRPTNPYAVAKAKAQEVIREARDETGVFASSAILFNHESPRRSPLFVSRKISSGVARIAAGEANELRLWNLDSSRDWGFAGDYVRAMWLMTQHHRAEDFVIATGTTHTVRDFVAAAFAAVGIEEWEPLVVTEAGSSETGSPGDFTKAQAALGWGPEVSFEGLVSMMVDHDRGLLDQGSTGHHS